MYYLGILTEGAPKLAEKYGEIAVIQDVKLEGGKIRLFLGKEKEKAFNFQRYGSFLHLAICNRGIKHPLLQQLVCPMCGTDRDCDCGKL